MYVALSEGRCFNMYYVQLVLIKMFVTYNLSWRENIYDVSGGRIFIFC